MKSNQIESFLAKHYDNTDLRELIGTPKLTDIPRSELIKQAVVMLEIINENSIDFKKISLEDMKTKTSTEVIALVAKELDKTNKLLKLKKEANKKKAIAKTAKTKETQAKKKVNAEKKKIAPKKSFKLARKTKATKIESKDSNGNKFVANTVKVVIVAGMVVLVYFAIKGVVKSSAPKLEPTKAPGKTEEAQPTIQSEEKSAEEKIVDVVIEQEETLTEEKIVEMATEFQKTSKEDFETEDIVTLIKYLNDETYMPEKDEDLYEIINTMYEITSSAFNGNTTEVLEMLVFDKEERQLIANTSGRFQEMINTDMDDKGMALEVIKGIHDEYESFGSANTDLPERVELLKNIIDLNTVAYGSGKHGIGFITVNNPDFGEVPFLINSFENQDEDDFIDNLEQLQEDIIETELKQLGEPCPVLTK